MVPVREPWTTASQVSDFRWPELPRWGDCRAVDGVGPCAASLVPRVGEREHRSRCRRRVRTPGEPSHRPDTSRAQGNDNTIHSDAPCPLAPPQAYGHVVVGRARYGRDDTRGQSGWLPRARWSYPVAGSTASSSSGRSHPCSPLIDGPAVASDYPPRGDRVVPAGHREDSVSLSTIACGCTPQILLSRGSPLSARCPIRTKQTVVRTDSTDEHCSVLWEVPASRRSPASRAR